MLAPLRRSPSHDSESPHESFPNALCAKLLPETCFRPYKMVSEGADGAIASRATRRLGINERALQEHSLNNFLARHVCEALIVCFGRRCWRHGVWPVETIRNHQTTASETYFRAEIRPAPLVRTKQIETIY
jgi:hypothetical protein